jgi:hypothetical protein
MGVAEGATAGREALQRSAVNGPLRVVLRGSGASQIFCENQPDGDEDQHEVCEQQESEMRVGSVMAAPGLVRVVNGDASRLNPLVTNTRLQPSRS